MQKVATIAGQIIFKAPVVGKMTATNILDGCKAVGMRPVCYDESYADSNCVITRDDIENAGAPTHLFGLILRALCWGDPDYGWINCLKKFPAFQDIFTYMHNYSSGSCGTNRKDYSCNGNSKTNLFAACVI